MAVFMTSDVLNAMVSSLFPIGGGGGQQHSLNSEPSTPVEELNRQFVMVESSSDGNKEPLTFHKAKKTLMDFLRTIVIDSLSLPVTTGGVGNSAASNIRPVPIIDVIMDACPDSASYHQHCQFQTELLSIVMEYLASAGVIIGEQGVLPIVTQNGGNIQNVAPNVFYLAGRLVDKLWQGILNKDPHQVLDFVVQLITQAKKRTNSIGGSGSGNSSSSSSLGAQSLDNIYRCLNRCILYLLSRPADSVTDQMSILEALHKLTTHRLDSFISRTISRSCDSHLILFQELGLWFRQSRPGIHRLFVLLSSPVNSDPENLVSY